MNVGEADHAGASPPSPERAFISLFRGTFAFFVHENLTFEKAKMHIFLFVFAGEGQKIYI